MILAVTGHRPNKLFGYELSHPKYRILYNILFAQLEDNIPELCVSGMALGVDTLFAIASINYKKKYPDRSAKLECAIPCLNHSCKWNDKDKQIYNNILGKADIVTLVTNEEYQPWLMQKRNEYMVDKCDILLAVWDGSAVGTNNCVKYARKLDKEIIIIDPRKIL